VDSGKFSELHDHGFNMHNLGQDTKSVSLRREAGQRQTTPDLMVCLRHIINLKDGTLVDLQDDGTFLTNRKLQVHVQSMGRQWQGSREDCNASRQCYRINC